jgi:hypothetical protein
MRRSVVIGLIMFCCQLAFSQLQRAPVSVPASNEAANGGTTWRLWYDSPSGVIRENALPVGNGRLGAMVYGNLEKEILQLNEHPVWSGSPNRNDNPASRAVFGEIRQLIFQGKQKEAGQMANKVILSRQSHGQMFQPMGNLEIAFGGHGLRCLSKKYYTKCRIVFSDRQTNAD